MWEAIEFVHRLPYGRTRDRTDFRQVLEENKGACSTKHALLAALAEELYIPLKLVLGMFLLTKKNTPNLTPILDKYQVDAIPEAHCYLIYKGQYLDITFPNSTFFTPLLKVLQEIVITPEQIGKYKVEYHQAFIYSWLKNDPTTFDRIWSAREAWISCITQLKTRFSEKIEGEVKRNE